MPKISVIIPTYNRAQMVCERVASVLAMLWPVVQEARKCFAAYGAMFMARRGVVEKTGRPVPFYGFFHTCYEEVNFCHRVWLAG